jgi:hypothetical protein
MSRRHSPKRFDEPELASANWKMAGISNKEPLEGGR